MIERLDLADPDVAAQVHEIQRSAYRMEADLIGFDGIPPLHESLGEMVSRPLQWFGVREEGRVVAAIAVTGEGRTCDIDRLVVHPQWQRRGLARRLVQAVLLHDVVTVSTGTLNTPAMTLYQSLGFHPVDIREIGPGVTVTEFERRNSHMATSFDTDVANYERSRPPYPDALFDHLRDICQIGPGTRVLEIGPGPGKATLPLLDLGAHVVGVEPGPAMAARLRELVAGRPCTVVESTFEDAPLTGPFDMVAAATSFHWVDVEIGVRKAAELLGGRGWLAVWTNVHRKLEDEPDRWDEALGAIAARFQTRERWDTKTFAFDVEARTADLTSAGLFELVEHLVFQWSWTHDAASLRDLFASFSDWSTLPEPDRTTALDGIARIVDELFGGSITRTYCTALYLARPAGTLGQGSSARG